MLSLRVLAVGRFDSIHSCLDMFSLSLGKRQSVIPQEQGSVCMLCTDMSHFRFPMSSPYCHIECFMILNHSGCYTLSVSSHVVLCLCNLLGRLSSPSILQVHCDFLNLFHLIFAALCLVLHSWSCCGSGEGYEFCSISSLWEGMPRSLHRGEDVFCITLRKSSN